MTRLLFSFSKALRVKYEPISWGREQKEQINPVSLPFVWLYVGNNIEITLARGQLSDTKTHHRIKSTCLEAICCPEWLFFTFVEKITNIIRDYRLQVNTTF